MPIDFHDSQNRDTYANRSVRSNWTGCIQLLIDPAGKHVADIGCGGGIYTRAWAMLGAKKVTGVDFSQQMVEAATEAVQDWPAIAIQKGAACATHLPAASVDIVFERALIHHLKDRIPCFQEANRLLVSGGQIIIQDRTPEDVALPGMPTHIRGYFFEIFPKLMEVEMSRRPTQAGVEEELRQTGFDQIQTLTLWESRRAYPNRQALAQDLNGRTGRSILHELSDAELRQLIDYIMEKLPAQGEIQEQDRWTIWSAHKG